MLLLYHRQNGTQRTLRLCFTFHYASTISPSGIMDPQKIQLYIPLCFYYIIYPMRRLEMLLPLHSTMLLLYPSDHICIPRISCFTFHYASTISSLTSSHALFMISLHSTMLLLYPELQAMLPLHAPFTFHYASTISRYCFPLLFSSIQVHFLSTSFPH